VGLADLSRILGTALTETAGFLAAGFKKFFNITTPTLTVAGVDQTGDSFARIGAPVGASIAADIAAVPAAVWASGSRTLTSFGTLVSQVAAAVAALAVESGVTILGALQCILAGTTGETAEGPATQDFKAPDKTTTRVRTVSDTDGNRTSSTLTPDV
jgi:hypothetical protein